MFDPSILATVLVAATIARAALGPIDTWPGVPLLSAVVFPLIATAFALGLPALALGAAGLLHWPVARGVAMSLGASTRRPWRRLLASVLASVFADTIVVGAIAGWNGSAGVAYAMASTFVAGFLIWFLVIARQPRLAANETGLRAIITRTAVAAVPPGSSDAPPVRLRTPLEVRWAAETAVAGSTRWCVTWPASLEGFVMGIAIRDGWITSTTREFPDIVVIGTPFGWDDKLREAFGRGASNETLGAWAWLAVTYGVRRFGDGVTAAVHAAAAPRVVTLRGAGGAGAIVELSMRDVGGPRPVLDVRIEPAP